MPTGLALLAVFTAPDGTEGYTIMHADGSPLTYEEGIAILRILAEHSDQFFTRLIAPPPIINT